MITDPHELANDQAEMVYRRLRATEIPYVRLEAVINELCADAMRAIGAETLGGFDPAAQELFGNLGPVTRQITQEIAEHVFRSSRDYLEGRRRLSVVH